MTRILAYGLFLIIATTFANASDHTSKGRTQKEVKEATQLLYKITENAQSYKDNPSNETYAALWQSFEHWIHQLATKHIDASNQCKSCQALAKVGLKIIDAAGSGGSIKIYTFSPQAICAQNKSITIESRDLLIQSDEVSESQSSPRLEKHSRHGKTKRARLRAARARKITAMHTQSMSLPPNTEIRQISLLNSASGKNRFLAILGLDLQSGHTWFEGMKHTNTGWAQDVELWQQVPSFLLQTGQAKVRLSENNLVITIGGRGTADNSGTGSYELVMPFIENHFALTRNEAQDPAKAVALQFLLAVQGKRADLAKIWLIDPQLASIPGYLGLYNHAANSPAFKLINMSPPLNGGARFRLITSTKDDLIVDVGKVKTQWLIKGLYIAPADSLAKEIGRILPAETNN